MQCYCENKHSVPGNGSSTLNYTKTSTEEQVVLKFDKKLFTDRTGVIIYWAVIVGTKELKPTKGLGNMTLEGTWSNTNAGHTRQYQATPHLWNPFTKGQSQTWWQHKVIVTTSIKRVKYTVIARWGNNGVFSATLILFSMIPIDVCKKIVSQYKMHDYPFSFCILNIKEVCYYIILLLLAKNFLLS